MKNFLLMALLVFSQMSWADINWATYSEGALKQAQKEGKKVVLGFHKRGCGTCHAQDAALSEEGINKAKNVVFLMVQRKNSDHTPVYEKYGFSSRQWAAIVLLDSKGDETARIQPGVTSGHTIKQFVQQLM